MPNTVIKGFSLIEMLVVLTVFSVLILLVAQSISATLRNTKKGDSQITVKDNIDFAVSVMERQLHNANSIDLTNCSSGVTYMDQYRNTSSFQCLGPAGSQYIASGSARLTSDQVNLTQCLISCNPETPDTNSLPSVDIKLTGQSLGVSGDATTGTASISTKIYLRSY